MFYMEGTRELPALFESTVETRFLADMSPLDRMEIYYGERRWKWHQLELKPGITMNLPMFFKAGIAGGQLSLHSYRDRVLFDALNGRHPFEKEWYWKDGHYVRDSGRVYLEESVVHNRRLVNLLGIKYIFSAEELEEPSLREVARGESYIIYENLQALPRCFLVYKQETFRDDGEILDALVRGAVDVRTTALCTEEILTATSRVAIVSDRADVDVEEYSPNRVRVRVRTPREAILVLMDSYDGGWQAFDDGSPVTIHRVNYKFRGLRLTPGEHVVTFRYLPGSFLFGAGLTVAGILLIVLSAVFLRGVSRARGSGLEQQDAGSPCS
jgi:hypothetical protein